MPTIEVSVVMAVYNEERHLREALESILAQQDVQFELVVVNDHSTDRTSAILDEFASNHDNLRVALNPGKGKVSAFNHGVEIARGKWTCLFAGDDVMPQGSLAERVRIVEQAEPGLPIVGLCRLVSMSEHKKSDGHIIPKNPNRGGLTGVSYLMDKQAVALLFPVPDCLPNEDTWLETGVLHFNLSLVHSGIIGCKWRVHSGNSINMMVSFDEFNRKLTPRMEAYSLFLASHASELSDESRARLEAKVRCETARRSGNVIGIWRSGASLVERLRAISLSGRVFYGIRRQLYGLLSGW